MSTVRINWNVTDMDTNANTIQFPVAAQVDDGTGSFAASDCSTIAFQSVQSSRFIQLHMTLNQWPLNRPSPGRGLRSGLLGLPSAENVGPIANLPDLILGTGILTLTGLDNTPGDSPLQRKAAGTEQPELVSP